MFSHWVFDLVVHTPDLPLLGNTSPKLGLGLWNNALVAFSLETVLLLAGACVYLRGTKGVTATGKYGMMGQAAVLFLLNVFSMFGPPADSVGSMAVSSLVAYSAIGGIAFWLDRKRS